MTRIRLRVLVAAMVVATGCVTTTGTLQTAHTLPAGTWQVGAGATVPVSTRFATELASLASQAHDELTDGQPVTEEDERRALESALGVLLFQPAVVTPFSVRRGVADNMELGVRMAGPALRVDGKWRFADAAPAFALNLGFTHHTSIGASVAETAFDVFDTLTLVSFSRRDIDASVLVSGDEDSRVNWFGAARYVAAFTNLETRLDDVEFEMPGGEPLLRDTKTTMHLAGVGGGLRFGNRRVALLCELTVMRVLFEPSVLGQRVDLGGWMVEPGVGATLSF